MLAFFRLGGLLFSAAGFELCHPRSLLRHPRLFFGHPRLFGRQPTGLRSPCGGVLRLAAGLQKRLICVAEPLALRPAQGLLQRGAADQVAGALLGRGRFPGADRLAVDRGAQFLQLVAHPVAAEHRLVDRIGDAQLPVLGHHQAREPQLHLLSAGVGGDAALLLNRLHQPKQPAPVSFITLQQAVADGAQMHR